MSEYLSKEEIKKWRSSVEKITLEEYAARLGKKLQEEKKTNDLADMLYSHYNPSSESTNYNTVTKLEKIDLSQKVLIKPKKQVKSEELQHGENEPALDAMSETVAAKEEEKKENTSVETTEEETVPPTTEQMIKPEKTKSVKKNDKKIKDSTSQKENNKEKEIKQKSKKAAENEASAAKTKKENKKADISEKTKEEKQESNENLSELIDSLGITFNKALTDREEKVLIYFIEKRGEIVFAKDLAELLNLKRDYIYKYIKNLRAKMSTDLIVNADNGGFKLE